MMKSGGSLFDFVLFGSTTVSGALLGFIYTALLIASILYILFAFLAVRQIDIMSKTIMTPGAPLIRLIGYIHFAVSVGVFLFLLASFI